MRKTKTNKKNYRISIVNTIEAIKIQITLLFVVGSLEE